MPSRLRRYLRWIEQTAPAFDQTGTSAGVARPGNVARASAADVSLSEALAEGRFRTESVQEGQRCIPHHDPPLPPREEALYLLHIAAEVEHALMVEYLYGAFSLEGPQDTPEHAEQVAGWRATIYEVAREEMGHLATVQNLLQFIGGPVTFEREDFPIPRGLYPFDFTLEPVTRSSLARYVLAEAPPQTVIDKNPELARIMQRVREDAKVEGDSVNRVGALYDRLRELFTREIDVNDLVTDSVRFQARFDEWGLGQKHVLIYQATTRDDALKALKAVAEQGEGKSTDPDPDPSLDEPSHFERFLGIYQGFPPPPDPAAPAGQWVPARKVPRNPKVTRGPEGVDPQDESCITGTEAHLWAQLFNIRYRMLLFCLIHSFMTEAPAVQGQRTPRGLLLSWAFGEMYNVRTIGNLLTRLPLTDHAGEERMAGAPFELPYSLDLPPREPDRWRLHRDSWTASSMLVETLLSRFQTKMPVGHCRYLQGLLSTGREVLDELAPLIAG